MHLAEIFNDHMVLQRDEKICIFGYGKGEGTIEFCGEKYDFICKSDEFRLYLPPQPAGGPFEMNVILNGDRQIIKDIMIGDVYIAGGQSNIEFRLNETSDIEYTTNKNIRFFNEPNDADEEGNHRCDPANWIVCDGKSADEFSAIGYYFAVELQKHTNVPVGIISCAKGASRVDAWTNPEIVQTKQYQEMIKIRHNDYNTYKFNHNSWLYNNKLLNIVPFANSGVLWYQGESNRCYNEGVHYAKMLEIMIKNWRELWECKLPFYCVQLMPYVESEELADWAIIRSQQELASKIIDNVYLVTLVDTGEKELIHPLKKKEVSYALSKAVRNIQFNDSVEYCGPVLEKYDSHKNGIELFFTHSDGLHIKGDNLLDLCVYSQNDELLPVDFTIERNCLKLFWQMNVVPKRITLGYCNAPMHNLYNDSDYLASPFSLKFI